ncbi:Mucin-like protein [Holothuria leucospilota]|uniref:Mucin-like protein n=1 Tax=Holothuria leucospilota TaxID=206669 RepID=A0A9Q1BZM1_HOLLE|nr:Mucin-like protein [Holothuria leucospilota]
MKCCYRDDHSLIEGFQTLWRSSFIQRHQFIYGTYIDEVKRQDWIDDDLVPRYDCCVASQDPAFCAMYEEKRPAGTCNGYLPPETGWMFGDPHMQTLDKYPYTFNGLGEYILVDINNGEFVLQGRMERALVNEELADGTVFTGFAGKLQNSTLIEIYLNENRTDYTVRVNSSILINRTDLMDVPFYAEADPNFYMEMEQGNFTNSNGSDRLVVYWVYGVSISVAMSTPGMLDVFFEVTNKFKGNSTKGLFGVWNDDMMDDFLLSNGSRLDTGGRQNLTDREVFAFGESWRCPPEKSLFSYRDGMNWTSYNDLDFVPVFLDELVTQYENATIYKLASVACGENIQCLFDSLATMDVSIGLGTRKTSFVLEDDAQWLANFPPNITEGDTQILAEVGEEVEMRIKAVDIDGDQITFSLFADILNATLEQLSDNVARFVWTPVSTDPVRLQIVASDRRSISVLVVDVIICSCFNGGSCDFDNLVDGSNLLEDHFAVASCICPPAWTGDDCREDYDACLDDPCFPGVTCKDEIVPEANATCGQCPTGLVGNGFKCYDNDECDSGANDCDPQFSVCENLPGSYNCTCLEGFSDVYNNGSMCEDEDECSTGTASCSDSESAECLNTIGSYICRCLEGYTEGNNTCEDIDECQDSPCAADAVCTNTNGSFACVCNSGFMGDGFSCENVNECEEGSMTCFSNGTCVTTAVACSTDATCFNTNGSYDCQCKSGFRGTGLECVDIDECLNETSCNAMADCLNTNGSYVCTCPDGYRGNGFDNCTNIDECAENIDDCDMKAFCVDTDGGYNCTCNTGYSGNGTACETSKSFTMNVVFTDIKGWNVNSFFSLYNLTQVSTDLAIDVDALFQKTFVATDYLGCDVQSFSNESMGVDVEFRVDLVVSTDYALVDIETAFDSGLTGRNKDFVEPDSRVLKVSVNVTLPLIDPCAEGTHTCFERDFTQCVFTGNNSYTCQNCRDGFQLNNNSCEDINECLNDPCASLVEADCINTNGSYYCTCREGYMQYDGVCRAAAEFRGQFLIQEVNATQTFIATSALNVLIIDEQSYPLYASTVCAVVEYNLLMAEHIAPSYLACEMLGFSSTDVGPMVYFVVGLTPTSNITEDNLTQTLIESVDENNRLYSDREGESVTINTTTVAFAETPIHQRPIVGIILGVLGGILLIFLILVCCLVVLISYSQRQQQLRAKEPYLFDSMPTLPFKGIASDFYSQDDTLSDTSDSIISEETIRSLSSSQSRGTSWELARRISDIDEDTRMRYLMDVIRNSPYINERMRAQVPNLSEYLPYSDLASTAPSIGVDSLSLISSDSSFVRPYIATGLEASETSSESTSSGTYESIGRTFRFPRPRVTLRRVNSINLEQVPEDEENENEREARDSGTDGNQNVLPFEYF